jgi:hypothetical protein
VPPCPGHIELAGEAHFFEGGTTIQELFAGIHVLRPKFFTFLPLQTHGAGGGEGAGTVGVPMGRGHGSCMGKLYFLREAPPIKRYSLLTTHSGHIFPLSPLQAPWSGAGMTQFVFC